MQPPHSSVDPLGSAQRAAVVAHYQRVVPWLLPHVADTPLIVALYPGGLDTHATFLASLHDEPVPATIPTVDVPAHDGGWMRYLAFAENAALWQVHRRAIELHSWTPSPRDPERARFARIILAPNPGATLDLVKIAALGLRTALLERGLQAIVGLDPNGAVLWIPFDDLPHYDTLRAWLHTIADAVIAAHPNVFTHARDPERIRIDVGSNAVGRFSALPYSIRGNAALTMLTPIAWSDLGAAHPATLANPPTHDVFSEQLAHIPTQNFAAQQRPPIALLAADPAHAHQHVVDALKQLLADGQAHAADDLCAAGIAAHLLPPGTKPEYVVNAVRGLIGRQTLRGERPDFVELVDGRFRLNVPLDPFPAEPEPAVHNPDVDELCERLRATANRKIPPSDDDKGNTGAPFERAVADAFTHLGFIAIRDGRHAAPDVVATAPLGASAYTIAAECKSFESTDPHVQWVAASEAARFRDQVGAEYAILIGPNMPGDKPLDEELLTHNVALWTVEDLIALLQADATHPIAWPTYIPLLTPGRSTQRITDTIFTHHHGPRQRAHIALTLMQEEALTYQRSLTTADTQVQRTDAALTIESLTLLVNQRLERNGDLARMGTNDIRAAVAIATSALVEAAHQEAESITLIRRPTPIATI
jgi:bifunctional non-homologous end joining protein LigD